MHFPKVRTLALVATLLPLPLIAQAQDRSIAYTRLHLASELRYETQNMARLACYIGANFNPEVLRGALQEASTDFVASLAALKDGGEAFELPPETNARVLAELRALRGAWPEMAVRLGQVVAGEAPSHADIAAINLASLALLKYSESLANRIASVNGEMLHDLPLIMTLSVDMAGRQIMRTQKAAKEACLIGSGIDPVQNRQNLQETVTVFSATMQALLSGFPGMIVRPPTPEIKAMLEEANALWSAPKAALAQLYTSGEASPEDRMVIGLGLEAVAAIIEDVAALYQDIETNS